MLNIGPLELMVIFLIALIVVGPRKLPDLGRTIGKGLQEFRKAQQEVRESLDLSDLKDVKRELDEAQRGVREMLRFDTRDTPSGGSTQPPAQPTGSAAGSDDGSEAAADASTGSAMPATHAEPSSEVADPRATPPASETPPAPTESP